MRARTFAPVAVTCAVVPLVTTALVLNLSSTPTTFAQQATTLTPTPTSTTTTTFSTRSLPASAFLQAITPLPVPTSTPTPQPTATPTVAPTLVVNNPVATLAPLSTTPTTSTSTTTTSATTSTSSLVSADPSASATPLVASPFGAPSLSTASTPVPNAATDTSAPLPAPQAPQGLPPSAIFVPGAAPSTDASAPVAPTSNLGGPYEQVIDATQGGTLGLPDRSLQLAIPGGVADTDFLLVSLAEVGPTSAGGNLQVGNRVFSLTLIDSGGGTVTTFGTPILVTVTAASGTAIAALDPDSGQFLPINAEADQSGQLTASLGNLAAPAPTGVPDPSFAAASTQTTSAANTPQQQPGTPGDDPTAILNALGLTP